jgi:mono/diheme cytochrome c family protein
LNDLGQDLEERKGTGGTKNQVTQVSSLRPGIHASLSLGFLTACTVLAGCHGRQELTQQQAQGQHLYAVHCAHCHQENDLALKPPPPDIHGAMNRAKLPSGAPTTDAEVHRLILAGKGKMPSFSGRFSEKQIAALLAYLRTDMPAPNGQQD